jgi:hypothetical protein
VDLFKVALVGEVEVMMVEVGLGQDKRGMLE